MLSPGFADAMHRSALARRAVDRADGRVIVSLRDGSGHGSVSRERWREVLDSYDRRVGPIARRTRWTTLALLPGILVFGLMLGPVLPYAGVLILLAMFGGPVVIYLRHTRAVRLVAVGIDRELHDCPSCAALRRRPRQLPRWFELAFLLLVGPDLLVSIAGEIGGPDLFRGSPWWGAGMGMVDWTALALIATRLSWAVLRRQRRPAPAPSAD